MIVTLIMLFLLMNIAFSYGYISGTYDDLKDNRKKSLLEFDIGMIGIVVMFTVFAKFGFFGG